MCVRSRANVCVCVHVRACVCWCKRVCVRVREWVRQKEEMNDRAVIPIHSVRERALVLARAYRNVLARVCALVRAGACGRARVYVCVCVRMCARALVRPSCVRVCTNE